MKLCHFQLVQTRRAKGLEDHQLKIHPPSNQKSSLKNVPEEIQGRQLKVNPDRGRREDLKTVGDQKRSGPGLDARG